MPDAHLSEFMPSGMMGMGSFLMNAPDCILDCTWLSGMATGASCYVPTLINLVSEFWSDRILNSIFRMLPFIVHGFPTFSMSLGKSTFFSNASMQPLSLYILTSETLFLFYLYLMWGKKLVKWKKAENGYISLVNNGTVSSEYLEETWLHPGAPPPPTTRLATGREEENFKN